MVKLRKKYLDGKVWERVDFDEEWDKRLCQLWTAKDVFRAYVKEAGKFVTRYAEYEVVED